MAWFSIQGGRAVLLEVFLAWSYEYQKNKEAILDLKSIREAGEGNTSWLFSVGLVQDNPHESGSSCNWMSGNGRVLSLGRMMFYACNLQWLASADLPKLRSSEGALRRVPGQNLSDTFPHLFGGLSSIKITIVCTFHAHLEIRLTLVRPISGADDREHLTLHVANIQSTKVSCGDMTFFWVYPIYPSAWLAVYCTYSEEVSTSAAKADVGWCHTSDIVGPCFAHWLLAWKVRCHKMNECFA